MNAPYKFDFIDIVAHHDITGKLIVDDYQVFFSGHCYSQNALEDEDPAAREWADLYALSEALVNDRAGNEVAALRDSGIYEPWPLTEADIDFLYELDQKAPHQDTVRANGHPVV